MPVLDKPASSSTAIESAPPWPAHALSRPLRCRCALVVGGITLALVLAEGGLRLAGYSRSYVNPLHSFHVGDMEVGYRGRPNFEARFKQREFDCLVRHDESGFRRHETPSPVARDAPSVYVLGDSFTWGWGVDQGQVYTDRLQEKLPDRRVVNRGLTGSGTAQQWCVFQRHVLPDLKAGDLVLLQFCQNDLWDNAHGHFPVTLVDGRPASIEPRQVLKSGMKSWLKEQSYLAVLVSFQVDRARLGRDRKKNVATTASWMDGGVDSPDAQATRYCWKLFQQACAERGARLALLFVPGQAELEEMNPLDAECLACDRVTRQLVHALARDIDLEVVDLLPKLLAAKSPGSERLTIGVDPHLSAHGHAVTAEILAEWVLRDGSLASAKRQDHL